ncbi:hypothetical protein FK529_08305 [Tsukamurella asaccharolytica]|uniref:3-hydroxyacyl-CoA dehydrogenase n=1 Tax=Tsukamurella asaccharolytica TaxID=2592067 RepID=A0A5C5RAG7_9ACTN|nr:hypothetical protein [Tsukamurella asaccharolytica]TWS20119.1 hypothetical protein FK529_08305 [Tsukamurella asaccharolytica]
MTSLLALLLRSRRIVAIDTADGSVTTVTDAAGPAPDGIVVVDGVLYWTTMGEPRVDPDIPGEKGRDYSARSGGVHRCSIDGSGLADVLPAGSITTGKQLTTDGAGYLYWSDREGCRVSRARLDGAGLEDVVAFDRVPGWENECVGVAVDAERWHVYWTQKGPSKGGRGRILRVGLPALDGATPLDHSGIEVVWDGLPEPIDLEIHGDHLYWTDRGDPAAGGNTLNRAPLTAAGDRGATPEILASGFHEAIGLAIDDEAGLAYVSALDGDIRAIGLPGTTGRDDRVLARLGEPVTGLALWRSPESAS